MVAFTYLASLAGGEWSAKRLAAEEGPELSAEAADTYTLQKELKKLSVDNSDGGPVRTLLSTISKNKLVFQVIVGGPVAAAAAAGGGAAAGAAPAAAAAAEEKKEEEEEEEEDEDMGFSLFD